MHMGVAKECFCAEASRDRHVRLPSEDQQEGEAYMCRTLKNTMHRTRHAATIRQRTCSETLWVLGSVTSKVLPDHSYHKDWQVCGFVHGDDVVCFLFFFWGGVRKSAPRPSLAWWPQSSNVKVALTGPDVTVVLRVLKRSCRLARCLA